MKKFEVGKKYQSKHWRYDVICVGYGIKGEPVVQTIYDDGTGGNVFVPGNQREWTKVVPERWTFIWLNKLNELSISETTYSSEDETKTAAEHILEGRGYQVVKLDKGL